MSFYKSQSQLPWRRFSTSRRCILCGRAKTCSITADGSIVWCKNTPSNHPSKSGIADGWLHYLDDSKPLPVQHLPPVKIARDPGNDTLLDAVYRELLKLFTLDPKHRDNLRQRGLSDDHIAQGLYGSLPARARYAEGERLASLFSDHQLAQVPGLIHRNGRWTIAGHPGLLVPVRSIYGHIVGIKVRLDQATEGGRYCYLSSSAHGGAKARLAVHAPAWSSPWHAEKLYITEGELKADVISALGGNAAVISIPGVKSWQLGRDAARLLRPQRIAVCMDMDRITNKDVAEAQRELVRALRAEDCAWDPRFKGLDDLLSAQQRKVAS